MFLNGCEQMVFSNSFPLNFFKIVKSLKLHSSATLLTSLLATIIFLFLKFLRSLPILIIEYSILPLNAKALLTGMVQGVVVHITTLQFFK